MQSLVANNASTQYMRRQREPGYSGQRGQRARQMSAGKEYGSELMRSGDMYVTVPRNVWHCAAQHPQLMAQFMAHHRLHSPGCRSIVSVTPRS